MQALKITLWLLLIPVVMGLVNAWMVFDNTYEYTPDLSKYADKRVTTLSQFDMDGDSSIVDWAVFTLTMALQFIFWALQILLSVVWLYPMMEKVFMIPSALSAIFQLMIWVTWVIGIIQVKHAVSFEGLW